jgi:hypothetical protein
LFWIFFVLVLSIAVLVLVIDRKAIVVKPFVVEDAFCIECLDSITSTSTVSLSTSTTNL